MEDWKARAEKAEAELARLQAVRDFNSHPNAPDPDSAVHRAMELRLEAAEAELARLREPAGDVGNLCDRLRGIYRVPITDGLGPVGCGEEPHNPNEFVRRFETPPIQREAADLLLRQAGEIERWRGLRDAIAELRGYGPEWPEHGNVPLAIAAGYSLTLTRATSAEALLREASEVIKGLNNLIVQGQKITTETLIGQPRGLSDKAGLGALIGLLDGPEQREAQGKANTFLARLEAADAKCAISAKTLLREAGEVMRGVVAVYDGGHSGHVVADAFARIRAFLAKLEKTDATK